METEEIEILEKWTISILSIISWESTIKFVPSYNFINIRAFIDWVAAQKFLTLKTL